MAYIDTFDTHTLKKELLGREGFSTVRVKTFPYCHGSDFDFLTTIYGTFGARYRLD